MSDNLGTLINSYTNGNLKVSIYDTGTRIIEAPDNEPLNPLFPLNIDIRVSNRCSFGQKPDGTYVLCDFCHESAKTDGEECDYEYLLKSLEGLPEGIELAIGCNEFTDGLYSFLQVVKSRNYISNLTVNQGHINSFLPKLKSSIDSDLIKGLGISYRESLPFRVPDEILNYEHTVIHTIVGIDDVYKVMDLVNKGVKKVLILGEKNFGFNKGRVQPSDHNQWVWQLPKVINTFEITSFDNLALDQLKVRRLFFNDSEYNTFYQREMSMYIDAPEKVYKPSSRSSKQVSMDSTTLVDFFQSIKAYQDLRVLP